MIKTINTILSLLLLMVVVGIPSATALTINANQAKMKTIGDLNGDAWNLWSNGDWGDYFKFARAGRYQVRIHCYGSPADGGWPRMALIIDGESSPTVTVDTNQPSDYTFPVDTDAGIHRIGVSFLNDAVSESGDRNLYIVTMSIDSLEGEADPVLAQESEWLADWRERIRQLEDATLAKAQASIEKVRKRDAILQLIDVNGQPVSGAQIDVELTNHQFLFGANIFMFDHFKDTVQDDIYKARFRDLFNYATTGFYWVAYEQERGKPLYAYTDKVVEWCSNNNIRLKGHPILWGHEAGIPPWSDGQPSAELRHQRVMDILSRYSRQIDFWEVVNEPSHIPGPPIDEPYRWARQADPKGHLIVNDYNIFVDGGPKFFELLQRAIKRNIPFDGIGIQGHEPQDVRYQMDRVWATLDQYATLGKAIHITEFCPASSGHDILGPGQQGKWDEAAQADFATKFYTVCFAHPAVVAITWWDVSDAGSWREGGGLLRADLSPKPVYNALHQLIREKWTTHARGVSNTDGQFVFRGFMGDYVARITHDGQVIERLFHLDKSQAEGQIIPVKLVADTAMLKAAPVK